MAHVVISVKLSIEQHESMMVWLRKIGEDLVSQDIEHPGHDFIVSLHPLENSASIVCGGANLDIGQVDFSKIIVND